MNQNTDASAAQINEALDQSWLAFQQFRRFSLKSRAQFLRQVALEIEELGDLLIETTKTETALPEARLKGEKARTIFQWNSYAKACEEGSWLQVRVDTAQPERIPPRPDIRKMQEPLGPVVVFGASNFPYAFSTAGGDTAAAFATGCTVVVKAHPAHPKTSALMAAAIEKAALACQLPAGVFAHISGTSFDTGKALVMHAKTKAVAFTGSYSGGRALYDWAKHRKEIIPVYAEMGSINPVFLLPEKLAAGPEELATLYAGSITLGVGQFCTNPGLILAVDGAPLEQFIQKLGSCIKAMKPAKMLHPGIAESYAKRKETALSQPGVTTIELAEPQAAAGEGAAAIATVSGTAFLNNPLLYEEVFGPYSLVVRCANPEELLSATRQLQGQLTATLMATENDICHHTILVDAVKDICGRIIINNIPTGVEVCRSMHHGGPFPATTFSQFTSVGADSFLRFVRPVCYQNWPDQLLPEALQEANPWNVPRMVNDVPAL